MQFSNDFLWGAASASYQIEGAYLEDGKGENIWDAYCQESGHVAHGENGNVACDHYHRFRAFSSIRIWSMLCWKLVLLQWLPCSTGIIRMPCTRKAAG